MGFAVFPSTASGFGLGAKDFDGRHSQIRLVG